jgi:hypothetical protein
MTDDRPEHETDPIADQDDFGGAASPDASLAARIDRSSAADSIDPLAGGSPADPLTTPVPAREETGSPALHEGPAAAPRTGRVDAAGATFGPDADRNRIGGAASGETPTESVGGAMGTPDAETRSGD